MSAVRTSVIVLLCAVIGGCAQQGSNAEHGAQGASTGGATSSLHAHPQAVEPVAGVVPSSAPQPAGDAAGVSVSVRANSSLPQPMSEAAVRQQLADSGQSASASQATLTPSGLAIAPIDAPAAVQEVIAAGNEIAKLPYRYGGGHLTYEDTAYDCSGSISYVFAAAHLLNHTVVSGQLMNWGDPGPGKWITIFANAGHVFMYVAGLRFDTVALAETGDRWSTKPADEGDLSSFAVRHPPGL